MYIVVAKDKKAARKEKKIAKTAGLVRCAAGHQVGSPSQPGRNIAGGGDRPGIPAVKKMLSSSDAHEGPQSFR